MNWFKWLFRKELKKIDEANLSNDIGKIGVIQAEPQKDVSEPVFAIVECMKKYPSRFKLHEVINLVEPHSWGIKTIVSDVITGKVIDFKQVYGPYSGEILYSDWKWLTQDELSLLKATFEEILENKKRRLYSIQRARVKEIYK